MILPMVQPGMENQIVSSSFSSQKEVEYNEETYSILVYIECSEIVFQIVSINTNPIKVFRNSFTLAKLIEINNYFFTCQTLEEARDKLNNFLDMRNYYIENNNENDNTIFFSFPSNPFIREIKLPLKKIKKENDISYDSLSDEMKKIIDKNELILGIDLGTTYSCAAIMIDQEIIVIQNSLGQTTTPSYVSFFSPNERVVGELAKLRPSDEDLVLFNSKRLLGKSIDDKEIKNIKNDLPFNLIEDSQYNNVKMYIQFNNNNNWASIKEFYPEQISAMILKKIVQDAEYYLSKKIGKNIKINKAVVTVPAYFNQKQREATKQACEIIDLKIERMINEPTAASLAYGYKTIENNSKYIIVIDFGGGTLDITLLKFMKNNNGVYCDIQFSYGDTNMGGEDFDYILIRRCLKGKNFQKKLPCNIRLKRACEAAKIKLSTSESTNIILEEYQPNININLQITKKQFEEDCSVLFKKFEKIIKDFIKEYKVNKSDISEVILVGGSTLIPKIQTIIKNIFSSSEIKTDLNPNEAVAKGAAILGGIISNLSYVNNINLLDVTNLSLGVNVLGQKMSSIIKRSTPIPIECKQTFKTVANNQTGASIEIYEGIKPKNKDNLFLGKFIIKDLPKRKAGKAKIEIKFDLNYDSILKVTAYDLENENNFKELTIEKPKGLRDIMDNLKNEENTMLEIDIKEYSEIKDSILELEEKVLKSKEQKEINSLNESIIEKIGGFILIIIKRIEKEKIVLSYIKYYFKKVCKYLEINNDYKTNKNFLNNLDIILEEIQYFNPELIFEIIEVFMDIADIYNKCLLQLIKNYHAKISQRFYNINKILKENEKNKTEIDFDDLFEKLISLKTLDSTAIYLSKKLIDEKINLKNSFLNEFEDFLLKIEVKEMIVKNLQNKMNGKEIIRLNNLIEKYKNCKTADPDDSLRLESINKVLFNNLDREMKKAENFIYVFKKMKDENPEKMNYIFDIYNPNEKKYSFTVLSEFMYSYDKEKQGQFLTEIRSEFQKLQNQTIEGPIKDVYGEINKYLNKLAQINSKKQLFSK